MDTYTESSSVVNVVIDTFFSVCLQMCFVCRLAETKFEGT